MAEKHYEVEFTCVQRVQMQSESAEELAARIDDIKDKLSTAIQFISHSRDDVKPVDDATIVHIVKQLPTTPITIVVTADVTAPNASIAQNEMILFARSGMQTGGEFNGVLIKNVGIQTLEKFNK